MSSKPAMLKRQNSGIWESLGILPILVVIVILFAVLNGNFLRPNNHPLISCMGRSSE